VWARYYTFSMATILPQGSPTSDNGWIMSSMIMGTTNFDYHIIKTDPDGNTPLTGCTPTTFTPTRSNGPTTIADPFYNSWSGTVGPQAISISAFNLNPASSVQCSFVACTPPTINTQPSNVTICSTGTANVSVAASAGPYQWQYNNSGTWANVVNGTPTGFSYTNATTNNMTINTTGVAQGTYQFRVMVGDVGCQAISEIINVTVPGATRLVPTGPQCSGTQLNFEAFPTTGATYTWTVTPPGGTSATPTSGNGQTFSFVPTNTTGSSVTFPVSVVITHNGVSCTVNFNPTILPTPAAPVVGTITHPTCTTPTGSVALSGLPSGSWTITASPGGATQNGSGTTEIFSGLNPSTNYTFTVTNADGCTSTTSTSAAINAAPASPSAPITGTVTQPTCLTPTGSVQLSGLPAGSWTVTASPGGATLNGSTTSATFTGLAPGNYTFTVTNGAGCTSTASSSVTINPVPGAPTAPVVGTITQTTCAVATGSVQLNGLPSGSWTLTMSPGAVVTNGSGTSTTISGLAAGTYTFTVTNDLGCTSPSSVNVVINAQPTTPTAPVLGTVTQPTCTVATGSVAISGLPAGTWTITASPGGATQNGSGTTATFSGLSAGTYTFTVTNSDGCTSAVSSTSALINPQPATPSAPITGTVTQPTCLTPTGTVQLSGLPAGSWTVTATPGGATLNGSTTSVTFTGLAPGTNYTFTVTNNDGCTSVVSASVTINTVPGAPTAPTAGTVTQPTCAVPTGTIEVASPLGAQYTYSIDGSTFQAGTTFSGLAPGTYTITVLDNTSGCSSVSVSTVTIDPVANAPIATLVSSTSVTCNGNTDGTLEISISGGTAPYNITWNPNVGNSTSVDNLPAGSYTVNITDDNGCSTSETFTVSAPNDLLVNGTSTNVLCGIADGTITTAVAGGTAPYTYAWTPNGETTTSLSELAAGTYSVQVTDDNGCTASQSFTLNTIGNLPVNIDPSYVEIEAGESVVLTATGGDNYVWTPTTGLSCTTCPNPTANPTVTTTYYVSATDDNGCVGGDSSIVVIKLACGDLFVPTIFSPNGTGPDANNKLCVFGTASCIEELKFQIFNRWGEIVFETTDIENCWDGNYKDKPANSGIFVYRLYVKLYNNDEPIDISGNTTLVR
jgi:gliding motility-associated-like protein